MSNFILRTRNNGETFLAQRDNAPEEVVAAIRAAHDRFDVLPNDFLYVVCSECDRCLTDGLHDDLDEIVDEVAEAIASRYPWDSECFKWASDNYSIFSQVEGDTDRRDDIVGSLRVCIWTAAYQAADAYVECIERFKQAA